MDRVRYAVVLLALVVPSAADEAELKYLKQRAQIRRGLAEKRFEFARAHFDRTEKLYKAGQVSEADLIDAHREHTRALVGVGLRRLEQQEITAAGAAPERDIAAPVVKGKDYVGMALQVEHGGAARLHTLAERVHAAAKKAAEAGQISAGELGGVRAGALAALSDREALSELLVLRSRFVKEGGKAGEVRAEARRIRAEAAAVRARVLLEAARARHAEANAAFQAGRLTQERLEALGLRVAELEAERDLAELDLARLRPVGK
jgi:hypothetical protein